MGVAHVGLVHCDPCECKVKGFRAVSSIERNVSNRRHLQGVRQAGGNCSVRREEIAWSLANAGQICNRNCGEGCLRKEGLKTVAYRR